MAKRGPKPHPDLLTPRESEVLALIKDGLTNAQIADHLNISPETAKYHVSEILSKLNVPTREAAAAWQPSSRPFSLGRALVAAASLGTLAAVIAGLALLSWGLSRSGTGSDAQESPSVAPTRQPTSSPDPTATFNPPTTPPTPGPTVPPIPPPAAVTNHRLVLLRPGDNLSSGQLFLADANGGNLTPLTEESRQAQFFGIFDSSRLYYTERVAEEESVLYRLDIESGESTELLRHEVRQFYSDRAAISPDERFIAFTNYTSIDVYDLQTGETRRMLQGEERGPCADVYPGCHGYAWPSWSDDGSALLAYEQFSEGRGPVILDPLSPTNTQVEPIREANIATLSPAGNSVCAYGQNYAPGPIYISSAPGWQPIEFMSDLPANGEDVAGCAWLSEDRLAISSIRNRKYGGLQNASAPSKIHILDLASGISTEVATIPPSEMSVQIGAFALVTDQFLLTNLLQYIPNGDTVGRPAWIDITTGAVHPIDAGGYVAVAVIPPNR